MPPRVYVEGEIWCKFCEKICLAYAPLLAYKLLPNTTKTNYQQPEKLKFTQQQKNNRDFLEIQN